MELKNITKLETQYPTDKQIDKKKLKKNIPTEWTKIGLTAFMFNLMMSRKSFALPGKIVDGELRGGFLPNNYGEPIELEWIKYMSTVLHILPIIMGILTLVETIRFAIKMKKSEETEKLKKRTIIFAVITAVLILIDIFFVGIGKELLIELL